MFISDPTAPQYFTKRELRRYKRSALTNISPLGHHKVVGDEQAVLFFFRFLFSFKGGDASGGCVNADGEV